MKSANRSANLILALAGVVFLLTLYPLPLYISQTVKRAEAAFSAGDYRSAADDYRLLAESLGVEWPLERLIATEILAGRYSEAIRLTYLMAGRFGWGMSARRLLTSAYMAQGRPELAMPYTDGLPHDVYLRWHLWEPALAGLRKEVGGGADGDAICTLGLLEAVYRPGAAIPTLEAAADIPGCGDVAEALLNAIEVGGEADVYPSIAMALMEHGRWDIALWAWDRAMEADGGNPAFWAYRGLCRENLGLDGLPDVMQSLLLAPDHPLAWYAMGICHRNRGDMERALGDFSQACRLAPDNPSYMVELGSTYRQMGRLDLAALWLHAGFSLAPDSIGFRRILAAFYAEESYALDGDGMAFIRQSVALYPYDADLRTSLGLALLNTGDAPDALVELTHAVDLDPGSARAAYYLGMAHEALGAPAEALEAYRLAASLAPDGPYGEAASLALERLGASR